MPGSTLPRRRGISSTTRSANGSPPSAEEGKGDFVPAGTTKGRSPSGDFAIALWKPSPPYGNDSWMVAAALSAAATTTHSQETAPNSQGQPVRKKSQPEPQPLFGREGSGGRGASLREAASPPRISAILPPPAFREGARGRGPFTERPPPSQNHDL